VRYDFNAYTANVAGVHYCEVRIIDEMERVITSPSFIMVVDERVVFDDDIITEEDRDTLLALDVIASEADRRSAEFDRKENEQVRSVAEDEREGAEIARVTAENARVSAENARKSAESARVSAENARKSAETAREQKFSQFDSRITEVERYLAEDYTVEDNTTAYEKTIPYNACEKAKILFIGGKTYNASSGFINIKPRALKVISPNMINYPYDTMPTSKSGLIIIHNEDGSITFNGTTTEELLYLLGIIPAEKGETFTLTGCPEGGDTSVYHLYANARNANNVDIYADDLNDIGDGATHTVISDEINYYIYINIAKGKTVKNLTFKPMLCHSTNKHLPFTKRGIYSTYKIPDDVRSLEGFGLGIDEDRCNFITYKGGKVMYSTRVREFTVPSAEYVGWANDGYKNIDFYAFKMPSDYISYKLDAFIMEGFETTTSANWDSGDFYGVATGRATEYEIWVGFPKGTPQNEAITSIVGKKVVYAIDRPTSVDITNKMPSTNLINVLGGYPLILDSEYNRAAPFGIKYLLKFKEDA
jgi:hypothetical protein